MGGRVPPRAVYRESRSREYPGIPDREIAFPGTGISRIASGKIGKVYYILLLSKIPDFFIALFENKEINIIICIFLYIYSNTREIMTIQDIEWCVRVNILNDRDNITEYLFSLFITIQ